jgi:hypothetical protein
MMRRVYFLLLVGCDSSQFDADKDHISDEEEEVWGTDPSKPDSDDDGLDDLIEITWTQTDPLIADTDEDGMNDGEEVLYGLDPTNPNSHPYTLGWPMATAARKNEMEVGVPPRHPTFGERIPRFSVFDKLEEQYDIFDLGGSDRPIVLSLLSPHTSPISSERVLIWLDGQTSGPAKYGVPSQWVRELGEEGLIYIALIVVSSIVQNPDNEPPLSSDLEEICFFPTPTFGCFADVLQFSHFYAGEPELDAWLLLDENMIVRSFSIDARSTIPPDGTVEFEEFERTLATMLDYTPPTYP